MDADAHSRAAAEAGAGLSFQMTNLRLAGHRTRFTGRIAAPPVMAQIPATAHSTR
jgi:hypothetical protein